MGFGDERQTIVASLLSVAPTVRGIETLSAIQQAEWDFLVTDRDVPYDTASHLSVLVLEGNDLGVPEDSEGMFLPTNHLVRSALTRSREYVLGSDLPPAVEALARRDLVLIIRQLGEADNLYTIREQTAPRRQGETPPALQAFALTTDGYALAGRFTRKGGVAECWSIPAGADLVEWTRVALEELSSRDPARCPPKNRWAEDRRWWTPAELEAAEQADRFRSERDVALADLNGRLGESEALVDQSHSTADQNERRMLAAQGSELAKVVSACLEEMGFAVEDMDAQATSGDKLEDLRIHPPENPDWTGLLEVRGYRGGARVGDLLRLMRFRGRFVQDAGHPPERTWYVVNHFIDEDPGGRQQALAGNPNEVEIFEEDNGLIVETPDLFRLWMAVRAGSIRPEDARVLLSAAVGRFSYP